jgi:hypothetical protein
MALETGRRYLAPFVYRYSSFQFGKTHLVGDLFFTKNFIMILDKIIPIF